MKKILLVIINLLFLVTVFAQGIDSVKVKKRNRFIPFAPSEAINSEYDELNPVMSPGADTLFFSRANHPDNKYGDFRSQDIWFSVWKNDGIWTEPERLNALFNESRYNAIYGVTQDGRYLVSGIYTKSGKYKKRGLSFVRFNGRSWGIPEKVPIKKVSGGNDGIMASAYINLEGDVMLFSYSPKWQNADNAHLRVSVLNEKGKWTSPKKTRYSMMTLNLGSIEAPFIAADDSTLYFSSYDKDTQDNFQHDIYVCYRADETFRNWSEPVKMDFYNFNTEGWDNYFKSFDLDDWGVFTTAKVGGSSEIYIAKLRERKPWVDVSGFIYLEGQPYKGEFEIKVNGATFTEAVIKNDSSWYSMQLPLGASYEIEPVALDLVSKITRVDVADDNEYVQTTADLELAKKPFLDLSGVVTLYDMPLLGEKFNVLVDGLMVDTLSTDTKTGEYSVKLPLGKKYELKPEASNYIAEMKVVDVTEDLVQVQKRVDLNMTTIPYMDFYGDLLDRKTNNKIPQEAFPKFVLNGQIVDTVDTSNGSYRIRLKWGEKYTFQVQANDYDPIVGTVDLTNKYNYEEVFVNLYAIPMEKYAVITGRVLDKKTDQPIKDEFKIDVDGSHSTNSTVDKATGVYEVRLSLGRTTVLTASSDYYFPISEIINLSDETENLRIEKDLYLIPLRVGENILLNNIFFEYGKSILKEESYPDLNRVVDVLRLLPKLKIEIGGHTDSYGKDAFNLALSKARAQAVVDYILSQGIQADRVSAKGYGETRPVATNMTPDGRAQNRRVEFTVLEQ